LTPEFGMEDKETAI